MINLTIQALNSIDPYILAIVYVLGFLASYVLIKFIRDQFYINTWAYVIIGSFLSLGSWITFLTIISVIGIVYLLNYIDHEPPRWL